MRMKQLARIITIMIIVAMSFASWGIATAGALSLKVPTQTTILAASKADACDALSQIGGSQQCASNGGKPQQSISDFVSGVVTIISYLAGAIAIIMIIISGIRYTTSGGDSNKVSSAKTALIYALVGVAIAALAQTLVHFVLNQASGV